MPISLTFRKVKYFMRPICSVCNQNVVAINYTSNNKVRYRKLCNSCSKKGKKVKSSIPAWFKAGYRKKIICDKCGYRAKFPEKQMSVYYIDGNLRNNATVNLRSVCLNCRIELTYSTTTWKESPITPDF